LLARSSPWLYINFDTDQATIRSGGKPAIAEIATLLKKDATLNRAGKNLTAGLRIATRFDTI